MYKLFNLGTLGQEKFHVYYSIVQIMNAVQEGLIYPNICCKMNILQA